LLNEARQQISGNIEKFFCGTIRTYLRLSIDFERGNVYEKWGVKNSRKDFRQHFIGTEMLFNKC